MNRHTNQAAAKKGPEGRLWPCSAPRDGLDDVKLTNRTTRTSAAQIVVGEIAVSGPIQAGPQDFYGAFYKKNAFAHEHTISTTALPVKRHPPLGSPHRPACDAPAPPVCWPTRPDRRSMRPPEERPPPPWRPPTGRPTHGDRLTPPPPPPRVRRAAVAGGTHAGARPPWRQARSHPCQWPSAPTAGNLRHKCGSGQPSCRCPCNGRTTHDKCSSSLPGRGATR